MINDLKSAIPELQYDIIGRLVPGMTLLALASLYNVTLVDDNGVKVGVDWIMKNGVAWVVGGYIVGYAAEKITELLYRYTLGLLSEIFPSDDSLWEPLKIFESTDNGRRYHLHLKVLAERTMFRILLVAFYLASVSPPRRLRRKAVAIHCPDNRNADSLLFRDSLPV